MMDSEQSFSPFSNSPIILHSEKQGFTLLDVQNSSSFSSGIGIPNVDSYIGVLEVYIHQARDIHNICIYHKQDVYAKLCLTSNPESTASTQIINGGGKNPVFNETLQLNVRTIESSLKCEIWMLSRVKKYLEDQLLGFALVPLSEVVVGNGRLMQEFPLSSTNLFHSPAGFVQLSLSYSGSSPEVMVVSRPPSSVNPNSSLLYSETDSPPACEYDKIEFPDLKMANENCLMVSEYIGLPCTTDMDSQSSKSLVTSDDGNHLNSEIGVLVVESFSTGSLDTIKALKSDNPPSSIPINFSPSTPIPTSSKSYPLGVSKSPNHDQAVSSQKERSSDNTDSEADSSGRPTNNTFAQSVLNIKIEPEQSVVQQDIVNMYMKSMQQFTESLAKMKLPMDIENGSTDLENVNPSSDQKLQASKGTGSRVFYGSRAFF
ncbi:uncharacterized protein LOC131219534 [Magnolia sinica]|uniref:uncharacterized protein LOC131219534 n=1 Tax=Magnolia sinica TaxID=86752 RepID=UPI002658901C|nr:uncharacterized protein LOC131219534 [Magnolia sinica]XP_058070714.1 uncharacterized protein LOC131219534 [Magnolia sinica]